MKKPLWLNKKISLVACRKLKGLLRELDLHTVCEESLCPNISECFHAKVATFMILGDICTRNCRFCNLATGAPASVDYKEPQRLRLAVEKLSLRYVVLTSPTRDDLEDGGAGIFCACVQEIKKLSFSPRVEILIPDFMGKRKSIEKVAHSGAEVIAHNLETVPSLYIKVRQQALYKRSLEVLKLLKAENPSIITKSGLMLGLGEGQDEVFEVFADLRKVSCDFLTLGQYLPPSSSHFPLKEYILPEKFAFLEKKALEYGFKAVKSSPYTRSSYFASALFENSAV
ncbi:MAG: lipoyl synthase [Candidatus Omnitrophica bacterium]|nr:lipoyl synthase [Candidatus Omnitrophota bacterium]